MSVPHAGGSLRKASSLCPHSLCIDFRVYSLMPVHIIIIGASMFLYSTFMPTETRQVLIDCKELIAPSPRLTSACLCRKMAAISLWG